MVILTIVILISTYCIACVDKPHRYSLSTIALGTIITITVDATTSTKAREAIEDAFSKIKYIESIMSPYNKDSDVYAINNNLSTTVRKETFDVIKLSLELSHKTNGLFDITFASVGQFWQFQSPSFTPPSPDLIKQYKQCVSYTYIHCNEKNFEITKDKPCITIGLGGIAKGYAIALAVKTLKKHGITEGIVEAGGDLEVIGDNYAKGYTVGIKHPRDDGIIGTVKLFNGQSIATSGDYERFAIYKGKRYHHIFNPKTGQPAKSDIISVSVITTNAALCDGYATALFIMGVHQALAFLLKQKELHLQCIIIDKSLNVYISKSLINTAHFNNLSVIAF